MLYIYDSVLEQIREHIADHMPERGGALLGEPGKPVVTKFIYDKSAETTISSYSPSRRLNSLVRMAERKDDLEFKGIIHSHPGGYDQPSGQDIKEITTGLGLNSHMPFYLAPIVTMNRCLLLKDHEVDLGDGKVSFYAGYRSDRKKGTYSLLKAIEMKQSLDIDLKEISITPIPKARFERDIKTVCDKVLDLNKPNFFIVEHDNNVMVAGNIEVKNQFDLTMLIDHDYPNKGPQILITYDDGKQEEKNPTWRQTIPSSQQLEDFIQSLLGNKIDQQPRKAPKASVKPKKGKKLSQPVKEKPIVNIVKPRIQRDSSASVQVIGNKNYVPLNKNPYNNLSNFKED